MKKVLLSAFAIMLIFSACKPDDNNTPEPTNNNNGGNNTGGGNEPQEIVVPEKNMSMVNKVTGSLCPPCGSWGWTAFETLISANKKDAFFVGTYSDNYVARLFITDEAEVMENRWGVTGFPTFVANAVAQLDRNGGVNVNSEIAKCNAVVAAHTAAPVYVNTGFETSIDGNTMTIKTRTKFFKDIDGDLYLAVYLIEDKVVGAQSGHPESPNTKHHYVLRGAASLEGATNKAETWGYPIGVAGTSTLTTAGTEEKHTYTIDITGYDQANLSVATVVYRKLGVRYSYINGNSDQK